MIRYSISSRYYLLSLSLILTFLFYQRNIESILDMSLYLEELVFLKNGSIIESRLFWKGEYFFLILLKIFSNILDPKTSLYLLVFSGIVLYLSALTKIARIHNINSFYILLLTSCSIYFYLVFGNTLRQGIALALALNATLFYYNKKYWLVLLFGIFSILSHRSAIILFIYPIIKELSNVKLKSYWTLFSLIIIFILFVNLKEYFYLKFYSYSMSNKDIFKDSIKLMISFALCVLIFFHSRKVPGYFKYTFVAITLIASIFISFDSISSRLLLYNQAITPFILLFLVKKESHSILIPFSLTYLFILMQTETMKSLFAF